MTDNIHVKDSYEIAFGITSLGGKVHESITKEAAKQAEKSMGSDSIDYRSNLSTTITPIKKYGNRYGKVLK
jgi:hypothetical protein